MAMKGRAAGLASIMFVLACALSAGFAAAGSDAGAEPDPDDETAVLLLEKAAAYQALAYCEASSGLYRKVAARYPDTVHADTAETRLDEVEAMKKRLQDEIGGIDMALDKAAEAGKMYEQAEQYQRMGTKKSLNAARFIYGEIIRRYPHTGAARRSVAPRREITDRLARMKDKPEFEHPIIRPHVNPFAQKDPEPPWATPQFGDGEERPEKDEGEAAGTSDSRD